MSDESPRHFDSADLDSSVLDSSDFENITLDAHGLKFSALALGEGPVVLCLHGFPDHRWSYRHQLPALARAGYRAVAPQLRGYEPGSQPDRKIASYHPVILASDVIVWARNLGGGEPVHLVGHDWGGMITYTACQLMPELFRTASVIAVPSNQAIEDGIRQYPIQLRNSWYMLFFQLRGLADRVVASRDFAFIEKLWRDWSPGWEWDPADMERLKSSFREPGVLWCALAYYRAMINFTLTETKRVRAMMRDPVDVPTLVITGAEDGCLDTRIFDCMDPKLFPAGLQIERIEDAGHFVHQERPERVNELLLDWLAR
jgi:pimeloyl-ACP methyl ester carboxylesterase